MTDVEGSAGQGPDRGILTIKEQDRVHPVAAPIGFVLGLSGLCERYDVPTCSSDVVFAPGQALQFVRLTNCKCGVHDSSEAS